MLEQPRLAWGASGLVTGGIGPLTGFGVGFKQPTANSSTTKGAKALASEFDRRRCRTVNTSCWWVREELLCSAP